MLNAHIIGLVFFLVCFTGGASIAGSLVVVTEPWPPYVYAESGKQMGFDYEVTAAVFSRMRI